MLVAVSHQHRAGPRIEPLPGVAKSPRRLDTVRTGSLRGTHLLSDRRRRQQPPPRRHVCSAGVRPAAAAGNIPAPIAWKNAQAHEPRATKTKTAIRTPRTTGPVFPFVEHLRAPSGTTPVSYHSVNHIPADHANRGTPRNRQNARCLPSPAKPRSRPLTRYRGPTRTALCHNDVYSLAQRATRATGFHTRLLLREHRLTHKILAQQPNVPTSPTHHRILHSRAV